jgi:hypothetical protein
VEQVIEIKRKPPLAIALGVEEPVDRFGGGAQIMALQAALQHIRSASHAHAADGLSDIVKTIKRHAAAVMRFSYQAHVVPEQLLQECIPLLEQVQEWCASATPRFAQLALSSQPGWNRQGTDRICKPLFDRCKRRRILGVAQSADEYATPDDDNGNVLPSPLLRMGASPQPHDTPPSPLPIESQQHLGDSFVAVRASRPVLNHCGLGNMVRTSHRTYPRRTPRSPS